MLKIILTGPESSGKTTLCTKLSKHFKIPSIHEYAREYIHNIQRDYNKNDLLNIAKGQFLLEKRKDNVLICDTDLITIKIWSLLKYKDCNNFILEKIHKKLKMIVKIIKLNNVKICKR